MINKLLLFFLFPVIFSCSSVNKRYEISGFAQGTTYKVIYYDTKERVTKFDVDEILNDFNKSCSLFDTTSLITKLNKGLTDSVDIHIIECEKLARHIYELSEGAYDITSHPLSEAYGFLKKEAIESINIDSILKFVGHDKLRIIDGKMIKDDGRIAINLNSIAQGYSVDLVSKYIMSNGINNYLVEIGGEVYCSGIKGDGSLWKVGIDKPIDGNVISGENLQIVVSLSNKGLNTSGNYRNFYIRKDGKRVNHILDPRSGESKSSDVLSATIIADNTAIADGYSTMMIVLGAEKSIEFLNHNSEIEGYIIYKENDIVKTYSTLKNK